jgi:hypothetical protein
VSVFDTGNPSMVHPPPGQKLSSRMVCVCTKSQPPPRQCGEWLSTNLHPPPSQVGLWQLMNRHLPPLHDTGASQSRYPQLPPLHPAVSLQGVGVVSVYFSSELLLPELHPKVANNAIRARFIHGFIQGRACVDVFLH